MSHGTLVTIPRPLTYPRTVIYEWILSQWYRDRRRTHEQRGLQPKSALFGLALCFRYMYVAVCCSVLQYVAVLSIVWSCTVYSTYICCSVLQCVAVCFCVLPCWASFGLVLHSQHTFVVVCCSGLQYVAVWCSSKRRLGRALCLRYTYVAVCCSDLQCVAVICSDLQWFAVCCSDLQWFVVLSVVLSSMVFSIYICVCAMPLRIYWAWISLARHCSTLQHTATHCNTLQQVAMLLRM